ncbi:phage antirepressor KilAC domain-containing protein [uncultured Ruminococcus sp.]|uniref:phage antirepressor n=1 Tax=uncultured Ruminococcus sp. TaxID=165186 RepID=UPI00262FE50F|nr:phage antirepressor KilAC domain-containing protein [uncultured Ruminococcus sp.]
MNEVKLWQYESHDVRTIEKDGEPWWVLSDVCKVLEIARGTKIAERLDEDEVRQTSIIDSLGRNQNTYVVNESGLYNVILRSDKPQAKPFRKWVTSEVLPSIRKHGAYMTESTLEQALTSPDFLIKLAEQLKDERKKRAALEQQAEIDKPKVIFADSVSVSTTSILVGELAKIIKQNGVDTGQNRLFSWMRENGFLINRKGTDYNMPTQRSMDMGLFEIKETSVTHSDGHVTVNKTPKVTGKGQVYFVNKFVGGVQIG